MLEGISFVTNNKGRRIAVQLNLDKYGEVWEDIYDSITARERAREPKSSLEDVKARLRQNEGDLAMPSTRLNGARGKVTDRNVLGKLRRLRAVLGDDYRLILENDTLTVEADLRDRSLRTKVARILAE